MTIADLSPRGKDILVLLIIILASTAAFGLGYLAGRDTAGREGKGGLWIERLASSTAETASSTALGGPAAVEAAAQPPAPVTAQTLKAQTSGNYVASRNGTKYYLPSCSGANRIKDENKVYFATKAEAEAKGYSAASNCPGL